MFLMATSPPRYRPRSTGNPQNDEALRVAFNHIYQLQDQISNLPTVTASTPAPIVTQIISGGGGGSIIASTIVTLSITLSGGGTATINPAAPTGGEQVLFVYLKEDGTGGTGLAWGANISTNTPVNINTLPNAPSLFQFMANGAIWQFASVAA